ncbi:leucine-rich repeat extensin-like protein 3-like, partial [Trifolium medium]|nr:leucine-rich repeat extensin-like protein 3-like [Trifolium medium]
MGLALLATVTSEDKVETPSDSSGLFCIIDCVTCPKICSPPPPSLLTPKTSHPPPSLPPTHSASHFSPPPP